MPVPFKKIAGPLPLSGVMNGAALAALNLPPLLAQIQALIHGAFGLGPLKADLLAQFKASVAISVSFGDPIAALRAAIQAALQVVASLRVMLSLGIPPINLQVSASLALAASLQVKIGGINLAIDLALGVRLAGLNLLAALQLHLSLGNVSLYGWSEQTMPQVQAQIQAYPFNGDGFLPNQQTYGIMLATATPGASASFAYMFLPLPP